MSDIVTSFRLLLSTVFVCCIAYPLVVLGFAQSVFPEKSQGSMLTDVDGNIIGSELIAQSFTEPKYFWPRPSAVEYDASGTGGSNLSPTNPVIAERASDLISRYELSEDEYITADLVTTSGSGIDPHITMAAAHLQIPRVAAARGLSAKEIETLVEQHRDAPTLTGLGGEALINVLRLNLAINKKQGD